MRLLKSISTRRSIIDGLRAGDQDAQKRFHERYGDAIYTFFKCFKVFGLQDNEVERIVSDIYLKAVDGSLVKTFDPDKYVKAADGSLVKTKFRNYLKTVLTNKISEYWEKKRKESKRLKLYMEEKGREMVIAEETQASQALQQVLIQATDAFEKAHARRIYEETIRFLENKFFSDESKEDEEKAETGEPTNLELLLKYRFGYLEDPDIKWSHIAREYGLTEDQVKGRVATARGWLKDAVFKVIGEETFDDDEALETLTEFIEALRKTSHNNNNEDEERSF